MTPNSNGLDGVGDGAQVHVPRHHLAERVGDADERSFHLGIAHAERPQQRTVRSARHAALDLVASHGHLFPRPPAASPNAAAASREVVMIPEKPRRAWGVREGKPGHP